MTIHGLTLQTQPTPVTCVQTCLAMALKVPVANVIARYGDEPMNQAKLEAALSECQFEWNRFVNGTMIFDGWYFAAVPSLNVRGGMHQILIHWDGERAVLDPSSRVTYAPDGSDLVTWCDLIPFYPGGRLPEANECPLSR